MWRRRFVANVMAERRTQLRHLVPKLAQLLGDVDEVPFLRCDLRIQTGDDVILKREAHFQISQSFVDFGQGRVHGA